MMALVFALSMAVSADAAGKGKISGFWNKVRKMIESVTPKKKMAVTTAVGGVRGAQTQADDELYWMDEETGKEISEAELTTFSNAVQIASEGKNEEALKMFDSFMSQYPESRFFNEAKEATEILRQEMVPAAE